MASDAAAGEGFFSSATFMRAVAKACYPRKRARRITVQVEGRAYRVMVVNDRVVDRLWHHSLYYQPLATVPSDAPRVPSLALVCLEQREADETYAIAPPGIPAPFIDWTRFATFEDYRGFTATRAKPPHWKRTAAYRRSLAREVGEVTFAPEDSDPAVVDTLLAWKSAQVRGWGEIDRLQVPAERRLIDQLQQRGVLSVATVRAGGRIAAGVLGYVHEGRFLFRLVVHDPALASYSPGQMLLQELLAHRFARGDREFDFMEGRDPYKFQYGTDMRVLGPVGQEPGLERLRHRASNAMHSIERRITQRNLLLRPEPGHERHRAPNTRTAQEAGDVDPQ